ncbi:MAG: UDP-N-acetylmuramoyl-L-alanyl-D-glutamate--2,6-diaminopimelate ligase, partial [Proteobacteria bacterium]|nr:UDP-N-acetylmuramoyl-L-alanyl-D-glutamate--2,6-diaminopimelate ligase [Pseudomonadota bacterium]
MISKKILLETVNPLKTEGNIPDSFDYFTDDTRELRKDTLFFAIKGETVDGHDLIKDNKDKILTAVVERDIPVDIPKIYVSSAKEAFYKILEITNNLNLERFKIIGITGTNGKTTFTYIMESIFKTANILSGVIGTVNYRCGDFSSEAGNTTPDLKRLIPLFKKFRELGAETIVMEVSSHSLKQNRLAGLKFDSAVFSNLTQEHLDFHTDMEDYYKSKKLLFTRHLKDNSFGVINIDDPYGERLFLELGDGRMKTYSFKKRATYRCKILENNEEGLEIEILSENLKDTVRANLKGGFNAYNVTSAYITALNLGLSAEIIKKGILNLKNVPGRMEEIKNDCGLKVFVDYAHTPDALENVLKTIKEICRG